MVTISLRTLIRQPLKVKRMTRTGMLVQVTDNGQPLWILQSAKATGAAEAQRLRKIDEILEEVLREKPAGNRLSDVIKEARR